jgi:ketosteroid isomerase-like protein
MVLLLVAGATACTGTGDADDDSATLAQLQEIELTRVRAVVAADVDAVAPLLADDFQLISPPGATLSRDQYLQALRSGDLEFQEFEPISAIEVRLYGDAAVLWYRSMMDVISAGQGQFAHETWHMYLYERRAGNWQLVREQATAIGGFPPDA